MDFNKASLKALDTEVREALEVIAAKHGINVKLNGGSYDPAGSYKPKVEFTAADMARTQYERDAIIFDLPADSFGKSFKSGGRTFTIAGLRTRAPKRPVTCKGDDGREYVFTVSAVKVGLGNA